MNNFFKRLNLFYQNAIDIVYPIECLGCKKEGEWLCVKCARALPLNTMAGCPACNNFSAYGEYCYNCRGAYRLTGVWIASNYHNELVKKIIKTLKYRFVPAVSKELGGLLIFYLGAELKKIAMAGWLEKNNQQNLPKVFLHFSDSLIIPVPLHKKRLRWRGFNQAEKLAGEVVKKFNLNYDAGSLTRRRYTSSQTTLSALERSRNLADSFSWRGGDLSGQNIILVDDVLTTGATLNECAKTLKQAGAGEIWGLVVAKGK